MIVVSALILLSIPVFGLEKSPYAEALNMLGIFQGTGKGFELDRIPTRSENLVMIIRLLGKEKEALKNSYPNPFIDTGWDNPYVSYGYQHFIVKGRSHNKFGGGEESSLRDYCTMLLRVLGYSDTKGDFAYQNAVSFASLVLGEELSEYGKFDRNKMAELTCYVLNTRKKDASVTLGKSLVEQGVFSQQTLDYAQKCWEQVKLYSSTTVLIYTVGSDLESKQGRLSNDVKEILRANAKENCRVLLQTGGTSKYHNEWMTDGKTERFQVEGSTLQSVDSTIENRTAAAHYLSDFIRWGVQTAPAERYILVLWDHGYGVKGGFGADELNQRKTMRVSEIGDAISDSAVFFDIIAFDACLMGTMETAFALKNHTKYLIASEDAIPACGLYYTTWLNALEKNPAISTERLGRLILDSFTLHAGIEANIPTTISMMKVERVEKLVSELSLFTEDLSQNAKQAKLLGENEGVFDQFDLLSIVGEVPKITAAVLALAPEVRTSSAGGQNCGVSIYVPVYKPEDMPDMIEELKKIGLKQEYIKILK